MEEQNQLKNQIPEATKEELYKIKRKIYHIRNMCESMLQENIEIDNTIERILKNK